MSYDIELAQRIRRLTRGALAEQRMFGGLAFLVNGNVAVVAANHRGLLLRTAPAESAVLRDSSPAQVVLRRGAPMPGWLRLPGEAVAADDELAAWVSRGVAFVRSLPPRR